MWSPEASGWPHRKAPHANEELFLFLGGFDFDI